MPSMPTPPSTLLPTTACSQPRRQSRAALPASSSAARPASASGPGRGRSGADRVAAVGAAAKEKRNTLLPLPGRSDPRWGEYDDARAPVAAASRSKPSAATRAGRPGRPAAHACHERALPGAAAAGGRAPGPP